MRNKVLKIFILLLICSLITYFKINFILINVQGESMIPTLKQSDKLLAIKSFKEVKRNDIVIFKNNPVDVLIKRVIALPNEEIHCIDGTIYINNQPISDKFSDITDNFDSIILKENEYFVLGDNRKYSTDSRTFGVINNNDIKGIVIMNLTHLKN